MNILLAIIGTPVVFAVVAALTALAYAFGHFVFIIVLLVGSVFIAGAITRLMYIKLGLMRPSEAQWLVVQ